MNEQGVSTIKQTELSAIQNAFGDVNERTRKAILEIKERLNAISPMPESISKDPSPSKPEMASVINSLQSHMRVANENADLLNQLAQHLTRIV